MKKGNLVYGAVGLAVGLAVVYLYVYVAGKGWQKSQKKSDNGFLNFSGANQSVGTCRRQNPDGSYTTYTAQGDRVPCPYGGNFTPKRQQKLSI
jgi:hypothetical protein